MCISVLYPYKRAWLAKRPQFTQNQLMMAMDRVDDYAEQHDWHQALWHAASAYQLAALLLQIDQDRYQDALIHFSHCTLLVTYFEDQIQADSFVDARDNRLRPFNRKKVSKPLPFLNPFNK